MSLCRPFRSDSVSQVQVNRNSTNLSRLDGIVNCRVHVERNRYGRGALCTARMCNVARLHLTRSSTAPNACDSRGTARCTASRPVQAASRMRWLTRSAASATHCVRHRSFAIFDTGVQFPVQATEGAIMRGNPVMKAKRVHGPTPNTVLVSRLRTERCYVKGCTNPVVLVRDVDLSSVKRCCRMHLDGRKVTRPSVVTPGNGWTPEWLSS